MSEGVRGDRNNMQALLQVHRFDWIESNSCMVAVMNILDATSALLCFLTHVHTVSVLLFVPVDALGYLSGVIAAHRITASSPDTDLPTVTGLRVSVFWLQQICVYAGVCGWLCS